MLTHYFICLCQILDSIFSCLIVFVQSIILSFYADSWNIFWLFRANLIVSCVHFRLSHRVRDTTFLFFKSLETLSHSDLGYCCLLQSFKAWLSFLWGWAFQKHQANTSSTRSATLSTFWKLIVFRALQIVPSCHARWENMEKVWRKWKRWKASTRWGKTLCLWFETLYSWLKTPYSLTRWLKILFLQHLSRLLKNHNICA